MSGGMRMRIAAMVALLAVAPVWADTINYGGFTLGPGLQSGHVGGAWNLTAGDILLTATVDMTGMSDAFSWSDTHAWGQLGMRTVGQADINPNNQGVWIATDYDGAAGTFAPNPSLDTDDKFVLQRVGGQAEGSYDLMSWTPSNTSLNYGFWFDRDGVDQWQAAYPSSVNGGTYNTNGIYQVALRLHATSATTGTAYLTINGISQGFYSGAWSQSGPDITPVGLSFTGDMTQLQVFYSFIPYGTRYSEAPSTLSIRDLTVTGTPLPEPATVTLLGIGLAAAGFRRVCRRRV